MSQPVLQATESQLEPANASFPEQCSKFPQLRFMGSKYRLLPWIHQVLADIDFDTAHDPFSGSGSVAYLLKAMGKQVTASDFLNFSTVMASALIANNSTYVTEDDLSFVLQSPAKSQSFVRRKFSGIFLRQQI